MKIKSCLNQKFAKYLDSKGLNLSRIVKAKRIYIYATLNTGSTINEVFLIECIKIYPTAIEFFIQGSSIQKITWRHKERYSFVRRQDSHTLSLNTDITPCFFEVM